MISADHFSGAAVGRVVTRTASVTATYCYCWSSGASEGFSGGMGHGLQGEVALTFC